MSAFDSAFNLDSLMGFGQSKSKKGKKSKSKRQSDPFDVLQMPKMSAPRKSKSKRKTTSFLDIPTPRSQKSDFGGMGGLGNFFGGVRKNGNGKKNGNGSKRVSAREAASGFEAPEFFGGLRATSQRPQSDGTFDDGMMKATPVQEGLGIQVPELGQDFNTRFGRIGSGFVENVDTFKVGFSPSGAGSQVGGSGTKGLSELEREAFRREGRKGGRKSKLSDRERELITLGRRTKQDEEKRKKLLSELEKSEKKKRKDFAKEAKRRDRAADAEERQVQRERETQSRGEEGNRAEELRDELGFAQAKAEESEEDFSGFTENGEEEDNRGFTDEQRERSERSELGEGKVFPSNRIFGVGV